MKYRDVSDNTSLAVIGKRTMNRKLIVLHTSEGYNSLGWLQGDSVSSGRPVSADFYLNRIGDIYQITKPGLFAFHTGTARWRYMQDPDYTLNQSAIGIELEAAEHRGQRITDLQYIGLAALLRALMSYHPLVDDPVITHAMCALPPGRKTDPRSLDWQIVAREMMHPSVESLGLVIPEVLP